MPDAIRDIPNGQMMIRDTGGWVEFWFKTSAATWNNQQGWSYSANNQNPSGTFRLARGGAWQKFGAVFVDYRQQVNFTIFGAGLGWPTTTHSAFIERARVPDPPHAPYFPDRSTGSIRAAFSYAYDGGLPIIGDEIWYSYDGTPRYAIPVRDGWINGLSPKTLYYFWGRVRNERGWSGFSARSEYRTLGVPDAPAPPDIFSTSARSVGGGFRTPYPWDGGLPIREWQIGYGLDPNVPQSFVSGTQITLSGLQSAKPYYFWARARNDVGWGPWSGRTNVLLNAGAWVKQAGVWKRAIPWIKVNGVWQIAKVHIPLGGTWRVPKS